MVKTYRLDDFGYEVEIKKVARQADGAVWFKCGGTVILTTVVSAEAKDFPGFLPLTVDYREYFSAAGKIPGGYYKREGKSSDREVLTARFTDRAIRPLFPARFFDSVQVVTTVYSVDKEHSPNTMALTAASLALSISKIPFLGPVGVVEMARLDGKWVVNPLYQDAQKADARVVIAGTKEGICMVEGSGNEMAEKEFVDTLFVAHESIKKIVAWQEAIAQELGEPKADRVNEYDWDMWEERGTAFLSDDVVKKACIADKVERSEYLKQLRKAFIADNTVDIETTKVPEKLLLYVFDSILNVKMTDLVLANKKRVDNREFNQIRNIATEVGLLPFTHGSSLFTRGNTQALATVTLGSGQDEQRLESIMDDETQNSSFMLHYNFPPFSVGEARPLRAPSRRETGHGYLAASAIKPMLPSKEDFPYTIRIVADILESDGSSSMATACSSTMALMHAGVPLKKMVGGIAMGLLRSTKTGDFEVLSDITGFEDAFGLMDFKVVGTEQGITAIQMDVKYKGGLARDVFDKALDQARNGRLYILGEMKKVMDKPNEEMSELVPKVITLKVDTDKIGAIIGGGGKTIREIIDVTKTSIDIESDGLVKIFGGTGADLDKAIAWVKTLAGQIERGAHFEGKIRKVADFGLFVELVPGMDGLVHVSNIPRDSQRAFSSEFKVDDVVKVEVLDYDEVTGRVSLRLVS